MEENRGEASKGLPEGTESSAGKRGIESPAIPEQLMEEVCIPKPDGGVRKLGDLTVLDRFIQRAVMQVLQGRWDRTFSDHSHGFRPGRSAH
jgi:hypothetical protein